MKAMITNEKIRADYILMHLIKSEVHETTLVRNGVGTFDKTISEYGIFGIYLHDTVNNKTVVNSNNGYLVRTKPELSEKGGVNCGAASISSMSLT